uniref:Serine/threonine-protein kinase PLK n=1 Tax=Trichobilharzia regenti TaxID=157069 RepID=A0AA85JU64_TRIRE|nr:unnamed protein product [Trichobilharzia regenti]
MATKEQVKPKDPPEIIVDATRRREFVRGRFLGKGGFAKCYELTDKKTGEKFAGKVINKAALVKQSQKEKMRQEISIHRTLKHDNVVGFHGNFEDNDFIYILLEICNRRSLLELHKRRKYVTEPEARYFVKQIVNGCQYLHENKIMHRDLKLANLFLDDNLKIKIGDFGLASRISREGEKKKTLCGTPNYIAPEVLGKGGHSFEVDSWSLGCILYTLLVGSPPFETNKLEETYARIKQNEYRIPIRVSINASMLIRSLLHANPEKRPNMFTVLDHDFFKEFTPSCLPVSILSTCPRFDTMHQSQSGRRPLSDINPVEDVPITSGGGGVATFGGAAVDKAVQPDDCWLGELQTKLARVLKEAREFEDSSPRAMEESEDPAACPIYWVSKWVDYSDKYGLGYQLCDNSYGVVFNDVTRLLLTTNEENIQYIDEKGTERLYTLSQHPDYLSKKVTLLTCFKSYMHQNLLKAGENIARPDADAMTRLPFLRRWFRTRSAIVLHLSNGTLQINFFDDHAKIILCPLMHAVTYIDANRDFRTYRFKLLRNFGLSADLANRLRYAATMIERLLMPPNIPVSSNSNDPTSKTIQPNTTDNVKFNKPASANLQKAYTNAAAAVAKGVAAVVRPPN